MGKRSAALALSILLTVSGHMVFASDSAPSVRTVLPESATVRMLPVDGKIGQIADWNSSREHLLLDQALGQPYSVQWVETYVEESMRSALVRMFGSWLSSHLPAKDAILSVAHGNPDGSVGINVRVKDSCMSFIILDAKIIAMRLLD